jgi:hypothetical protein
MTAISYRAVTCDVHDADVVTLAARLEEMEDVPRAAATAAGLRHPAAGQSVSLDDAAAIAIVLALMQPPTKTPDRVQLGDLSYRLRALRRGLEDELWPQAASNTSRVS